MAAADGRRKDEQELGASDEKERGGIEKEIKRKKRRKGGKRQAEDSDSE